jgi:RHS repeat-associated protein
VGQKKSMVKTWLANSSSNYGVLMKATNETTDGCDVRLRSSEYTDASYRPYLEVYYTRPIAKKYYLKDHLGNIRVTIDANGVVKAYDDYYPFGLQMTGRTYVSGLNNPIYKYSSKELDEENDLDWYYFGARYYDPGICRWLSLDPVANGQLWITPYHYCQINPINRIDLDGKWSEGNHNIIIDRAFGWLPDPTWINVIKNASKFVDTFQDPEYQPLHAMVAEGGDKAQAKITMEKFITNCKDYYIKTGDLFVLAMAMHPMMDKPCPAHEGFQEWSEKTNLKTLLKKLKHGEADSFGLTDELLNKIADEIKSFYLDALDKRKAYLESIGKEKDDSNNSSNSKSETESDYTHIMRSCLGLE